MSQFEHKANVKATGQWAKEQPKDHNRCTKILLWSFSFWFYYWLLKIKNWFHSLNLYRFHAMIDCHTMPCIEILLKRYSFSFSLTRNAVYSRYSTNDWGMSNSMNFSLSDKERSFAERLRADAWRAVKETDSRTRNRQNDITKKLGKNSKLLIFLSILSLTIEKLWNNHNFLNIKQEL